MVIETTAAYMIGEHTFKFVLEAQNGKTTTLSGKFLVVKATEKDMIAPSVSVSSDKDTLKLGESATITAYAKDNKAVSKIEILMFDGVVKECANTGVCVYQIGPITEKTYIKQYTYSAIAYDAAGNNIYSGNKYIAVDAIQPVTVEPNILIEASKANINTTETVTFKSTVNPGSKKLAKLPGMKLVNGQGFYNEFVIQVKNSEKTLQKLKNQGIEGGVDLSNYYPQLKNHLLFCATELNTKEEMDKVVKILNSL